MGFESWKKDSGSTLLPSPPHLYHPTHTFHKPKNTGREHLLEAGQRPALRTPKCESDLILTLHIILPSFSHLEITLFVVGGVQETQMIKVNLTYVLTHNWSSNIYGINGYILSRGLTVFSTLTMNDRGLLEAEDLSPYRIKDLACRARNLTHIPGLYFKMIRSSSLTG